MLAFVFSCRDKEASPEGEGSGFFPVLSFLQSQVAHVDTSLYRIVKITSVHGASDTSYVRREEFRTLARDFLTMPDITKDPEDYTETNHYDESLQTAVLNYMPKEADAEIRRQEVLIEPNAQTGDRVTTIIIERFIENKKKTVRKNMIWYVDKRFEVISITTPEKGRETIEKVQVIWNDPNRL